MRVNIYAEEMTDHLAIIEKTTPDGTFTGLRFYLELPVTLKALEGPIHLRGPFMHHPDDEDTSAVTFWGKRDLRTVLQQALEMLDRHYALHGDDDGEI